jgi:serine/threonine protein kinase
LLSDYGIDLASKLLALDPEKRPTAAEALQHPYFTKELPKPERPTGEPPFTPPPPSPPTQPNSNFVVCLIWKANGTNSNPNKENVPAENPNNRKHKLAQTQIQDGHPPLRTLSKPHHPPSQAFSGGFKEHGTCDRVSFIF